MCGDRRRSEQDTGPLCNICRCRGDAWSSWLRRRPCEHKLLQATLTAPTTLFWSIRCCTVACNPNSNLSYVCDQEVDVLRYVLSFCCAVEGDPRSMRLIPDAGPDKDRASYSLTANTADHSTSHLLQHITAEIKQTHETIAQH